MGDFGLDQKQTCLKYILTSGIRCLPRIGAAELGETATFIIHGQAMVCFTGKPPKAATFEDLVYVFIGAVLHIGTLYKGTDVVFERYYEKLIKEGTRTRRGQALEAIRSLIEFRNIPVPANRDTFMAHPENKADLTTFLPQLLILKVSPNKTVVMSVAFVDEEQNHMIQNWTQTNPKLSTKRQIQESFCIVQKFRPLTL